MSDQSKPHFEPPPWEQEAFERFRKKQDEARSRDELEAALLRVRSPEPDRARPSEADATDEATGAYHPAEVREQATPEAEKPTALPEARVDAMLIELRGEEPQASVANKGLIYGTIAFMGISGVYIIIRSALLFGSVKASPGVGMLLAGLLSFVVLLIGLGFLGAAFLLFRKYHQHL